MQSVRINRFFYFLFGLVLFWELPSCVSKPAKNPPEAQKEQAAVEKTCCSDQAEGFQKNDASDSFERETFAEFQDKEAKEEPHPIETEPTLFPENKEKTSPEKESRPDNTRRCFSKRACFLFHHPWRTPNEGWKQKITYHINGLTFSKEGALFTLYREYRSAGDAFFREGTLYFVDWKGNIRFSKKLINQLLWNVYTIILPEKGLFFYLKSFESDGTNDKTTRLHLHSLKSGKGVPFLFLQFPYLGLRGAFDKTFSHLVLPSKKELLCVSLDKKKIAWRYKLEKDPACSITIGSNSNIYTCLWDGTVIALSPNGKLLWKTKSQERVITSYKKDPYVHTHAFLMPDTQGKVAFGYNFLSVFSKEGTLIFSPEKPVYGGSAGTMNPMETILWGSGIGLATVEMKKLKLTTKSIRGGAPSIFEDSSFVSYDPIRKEFIHYSKDWKQLHSLQPDLSRFYLRSSLHSTNPIHVHNNKLYVIGYDQKENNADYKNIGILEFPFPAPKLANKGWPLLHSLYNQRKQLK